MGGGELHGRAAKNRTERERGKDASARPWGEGLCQDWQRTGEEERGAWAFPRRLGEMEEREDAPRRSVENGG